MKSIHGNFMNSWQNDRSEFVKTTMLNLKRPELKLGGNMSENFKNSDSTTTVSKLTTETW